MDFIEKLVATILNLDTGEQDLYIKKDEAYQATGDLKLRVLTIEEGGVLDMLDYKLTVTHKYQFLAERFCK